MGIYKSSTFHIYTALGYRFLVLMLIYSLCRIGFYLFNLSLFPDIGFEKLCIILIGGLKFDVVALVYINMLYILLQAAPFSFRYRDGYQQFCKWLFLITNGLGLIANFSDIAYYQFTLKRTTASVFQQFEDEQNLFGLFANFILDYWYLLVFFAGTMWLLMYLYKRVSVKATSNFTWKTYLLHTLCLTIIAGLCVIGVRGGWRHSTRPITLSNAGEYVDKPYEMNLVLNTPFTLLKTLKAQKLKPVHTYDEKTLNAIYNPVHMPQNKGAFNKLNVVFIIVESLGKEHIGALNKDLLNGTYKGYTPFLDSLTAHSYTFTNTYANGRKSIDALPSIISGIPSIQEPFVLSTYSGNKTTSIARLLGNEGYETAFFHGAPNGSMGFSSYTKLAGIQHYFGKTEYNNNSDFDGIWGIWDAPFLQFMAKTLDTLHQPFFSALFTVSSHHPFKVPEKYIGKFPKGPLPVQEPVGYTDMALRKFFATAATMSWYKNTVFVICADHATVSYLPEYKTIPGYFSIPILFYYPGGHLQGKSDKLVQQTDIMPTILNYLNYPKPYFAFGFDAFDPNISNFVVNNNEGVFNFYKGDYLLLSDGEKATALYDLKNDRLTKNNLIHQLPDIQKDMEKTLQAFIQQYNNRMIQDALTVQ